MSTLYYFGSFNPPGNHHYLMAEMAMERGGYDRVVFVPCYVAAHRDDLLSFEYRWEMLRIGGSHHGSRFEFSTVEKELYAVTGCKSYSLLTLRRLKEIHHEDPVHVLVGSDTLSLLPTWYQPDQVCRIAHFVVVPRAFDNVLEVISTVNAAVKTLGDKKGTKAQLAVQVFSTGFPKLDLSATLIRERVAAGLSIRYLVPRGVEEYISQNHLYKSTPTIPQNLPTDVESGSLFYCPACKRTTTALFSNGKRCDALQANGDHCYGVLVRQRLA